MNKPKRQTKWIKPHIYFERGFWRLILRGKVRIVAASVPDVARFWGNLGSEGVAE